MTGILPNYFLGTLYITGVTQHYFVILLCMKIAIFVTLIIAPILNFRSCRYAQGCVCTQQLGLHEKEKAVTLFAFIFSKPFTSIKRSLKSSMVSKPSC